MRLISRFKTPFVFALAALLLFTASGTATISAASAPAFTVTAASAFLRDAPSASAPRTYSVFKGQTFGITGCTADRAWLRIDFAAATQGTWILAALGTVAGDLNNVPVAPQGSASSPAAPGATTTLAPGVATTSAPNASATEPPGSNAPLLPAANATLATSTPSALKTEKVTLTLTVKSIYGLSAPGLTGQRVQSLFLGQVYTVRAKSADGQWVRVDFTGATTEVWVPVTAGKVSGDFDNLPVGDAAATPTAGPGTPTPQPASTKPLPPSIGPANYPIVPAVSANAREIYQRGLALGNNPHAFSKIGDCQNVVAFFLANFDNPKQYQLGKDYAYLQETINQFHGSFSRPSEAVRGGFNVASVLDPLWTNPKNCKPKETPLDCEFRINHPSIVFISMETWWAGAPAADYEKSLRQIVEYAINRGAVPILATKADNLEKDGGLNAAIVRVAEAYDVPLWNFWLAAHPLPNYGLLSDGFHLTIGHKGQFIFDDPANMQAAWPWRNLTALQALDAVWRSVR